MRLPIEQGSSHEDVAVAALDWAALGGLVRRETLDAVTLHFAMMAMEDIGSGTGDPSPAGSGRAGAQ